MTVSTIAEHILIIDDEQNYLLVLQALLEDRGFVVTALPTRKPPCTIWRNPKWTWSSRT